MKMSSFLVGWVGVMGMICAEVSFAAPNQAKVMATDADGKRVSIVLNASGAPVVAGKPKSLPTIKDFRVGTEYDSACYQGTPSDVKKVFQALVDAANGDGDSWASLKSVKVSKTAEIEVVAVIESEAGSRQERFVFPVCK